MWVMCVSVQGSQRESDPLELELQATVSHLMWQQAFLRAEPLPAVVDVFFELCMLL